jgi:hypothetical protein
MSVPRERLQEHHCPSALFRDPGRPSELSALRLPRVVPFSGRCMPPMRDVHLRRCHGCPPKRCVPPCMLSHAYHNTLSEHRPVLRCWAVATTQQPCAAAAAAAVDEGWQRGIPQHDACCERQVALQPGGCTAQPCISSTAGTARLVTIGHEQVAVYISAQHPGVFRLAA